MQPTDTSSELTPADVKAMPIEEFVKRFGFQPDDSLDKWAFAMTGTRISASARIAFAHGILETPDLSGIVME